ncbi:hypothetical protein QTN25_007661 [Entamoeba marina]
MKCLVDLNIFIQCSDLLKNLLNTCASHHKNDHYLSNVNIQKYVLPTNIVDISFSELELWHDELSEYVQQKLSVMSKIMDFTSLLKDVFVCIENDYIIHQKQYNEFVNTLNDIVDVLIQKTKNEYMGDVSQLQSRCNSTVNHYNSLKIDISKFPQQCSEHFNDVDIPCFELNDHISEKQLPFNYSTLPSDFGKTFVSNTTEKCLGAPLQKQTIPKFHTKKSFITTDSFKYKKLDEFDQILLQKQTNSQPPSTIIKCAVKRLVRERIKPLNTIERKT